MKKIQLILNIQILGIGVVEMLVEHGFWNISEIENCIGDVMQSHYIEVIGNIHDNPELLE